MSSLMISAMVPYSWKNNWGGNNAEKYHALKSTVKETILARASRILPGLERAVVFQDAATPRTFERYTHNTEGATSAWSWNPHKKFYPNTWSMHTGTPVRNLLIGSCWATQIGGIPGALGAAEECAKRIREA
jgi:phytoene dehydrogenase-like protein